jgi:hypothetical protein
MMPSNSYTLLNNNRPFYYTQKVFHFSLGCFKAMTPEGGLNKTMSSFDPYSITQAAEWTLVKKEDSQIAVEVEIIKINNQKIEKIGEIKNILEEIGEIKENTTTEAIQNNPELKKIDKTLTKMLKSFEVVGNQFEECNKKLKETTAPYKGIAFIGRFSGQSAVRGISLPFYIIQGTVHEVICVFGGFLSAGAGLFVGVVETLLTAPQFLIGAASGISNFAGKIFTHSNGFSSSSVVDCKVDVPERLDEEKSSSRAPCITFSGVLKMFCPCMSKKDSIASQADPVDTATLDSNRSIVVLN